MRRFTDAQGRKWEIEITVQQVRLVRNLLDINLYRAMADDFKIYNSIIGDPVLLVDLLCVLCRDQAKAAGVSDEQFGKAMRGDALQEAANAFTEELIDFFPDARTRAAMRTFMSKASELQGMLIENATKATANVQLTTSSSSGSSPASLEPTPTPSLSAS